MFYLYCVLFVLPFTQLYVNECGPKFASILYKQCGYRVSVIRQTLVGKVPPVRAKQMGSGGDKMCTVGFHKRNCIATNV